MSTSNFQYTIFTGSKDSKKIVKKTTERPIRPDDVVIKITHSGLCFTDVHARPQEIALGHEGVGVIERVGPAVKNRKVGDRVGFPFVRETCGHCMECLQGEDSYCHTPDAYSFPNSSKNLGSMASHAIITETFAIPIPDGLENLYAGPLMCAGATVFEPLFRHGAHAGDRIGIVGLGGLGHLAVQFASKMGCEVVVFSSTDDKREEAFSLGAHEFHATKGKESLEGVKPIKHLLVSTSFMPDWKLFIPVMDYRSTVFPLTVAEGSVDIPVLNLLMKGMRIQGSSTAPRSVYHSMLSFAALSGVKPMIKTFPMTEEGIAQAFDELEAGSLRYRAVLVAQD